MDLFTKIFKNTLSTWKNGVDESVSAQADRTTESDSLVVSSPAAEASTNHHEGGTALQGLMRPTVEASTNHHEGGAALESAALQDTRIDETCSRGRYKSS